MQLPSVVIGPGVAEHLSSTEVVDAVLDSIGDIPPRKQGGKLKEMEEDMAEFIQNQRYVLDLSAFVHANKRALAIALQPAYLDLSQRVQRCIMQEVRYCLIVCQCLCCNGVMALCDCWQRIVKRVIACLIFCQSELQWCGGSS